MQACRLLLPGTHPSSVVSSVLFEPVTRSLALMHSDSSILLYPPSPSSSSALFPSFGDPISIPAPVSSSSFLRLDDRSNGAESGRVLFLIVLPERRGGARTMVKAWVLGNKNRDFVPVRLRLKQRKESRNGDFGLSIDLTHGFSVRMVGAVNFFALHSLSERKIWVVGAKLGSGEGEGSLVVDLVKCAIVDCVFPIYTMRIFGGCMIFVEDNGVRVFPLRGLVKGRRKQTEKSNGSKSHGIHEDDEKLDRGAVEVDGTDDSKQSLVNTSKGASFQSTKKDAGHNVHGNDNNILLNCNDNLPKLENGGLCFGNFRRNGVIKKIDMGIGNLSFGSLVLHEDGKKMEPKIHHLHLNSEGGDDVGESAVKHVITDTGKGILPRLSSQGIKMPSVDSGEIKHALADAGNRVAKFQTMKLRQDSGELGSSFASLKSLNMPNSRACSIHSVCRRRFLILDTLGNLHLLNLASAVHASFSDKASVASPNMCSSPLQCSMKVHVLAVHPDASGTSTIWISDGCHSLYCMSLHDIDVPADETQNEPEKKKTVHLMVRQAIFTNEKIQEIVPLDGNSALVLGRENIFYYSVPGS